MPVIWSSNNIMTPPYDPRSYRLNILRNGMPVILITDPTTTKFGASINVWAGSEDEEIEGLAHFLEHMVFMGTEKYPDEKAFVKFVSENGGDFNAYTTKSSTNFHFDIVGKE